MPNLHRKLVRSASVTPPIPVPSNVSEWLNSQDDLALHNIQNQNNNVVEGHPPLSPQSSVTSSGSGSDTHDNDQQSRNTFLEEYSGMKGIFQETFGRPLDFLSVENSGHGPTHCLG